MLISMTIQLENCQVEQQADSAEVSRRAASANSLPGTI